MTTYCILLFFFRIINLHGDQPGKNSEKTIVAINYNLSSPDKIYILPDVLKEISGITELDATSIACVQDEKGILFIYDLIKEQIKTKNTFYYSGDYEGIGTADKTIYILRSDGMLFGITNFESAAAAVSYSTGITARDNEGLCFDQKANRLLIAPKSNSGKDSENKNHRFIYSFDLNSKKLVEKPAFIFDLKAIKKFALDNKIKVPMKDGKKGHKKDPDIEFRPSEIGINPITGRLFVLSGMEKMLYVFNMNGEIEYLEKLGGELFGQPEGITFLKNGDMLISNESKNKNPTILRFNYSTK